MPEAPRVLHLLIESCDDCPYRHYDEHYSMSTDCGWQCQHPDGYFRIADEGSRQTVQECGDSVARRLGKPFPDQCPLKDPSVVSTPVRSRSIQLDHYGNQNQEATEGDHDRVETREERQTGYV